MEQQSYEFFHALKKIHEVYLISWSHGLPLLPLFFMKAVVLGSYYCLKNRIDIVQMGDLSLSPLAVLFKYLFRKKTLAMSHGKDAFFKNVLYSTTVISVAKKLDGIVCVSPFLKQHLVTRGFIDGRLFAIPNGINVALYEHVLGREKSRHDIEKTYGINVRSRKIILSVSRLVKKKGLSNFIGNILPVIVRSIPNTLLLIVGESRKKEAKEEKSKILHAIEKHSLQKHIYFCGEVTDRTVLLRQLYTISDVFIMPNQHIEGDCEGFGIVALEAAMHELPVVAFRVDGIPAAVKDGENGRLLPEGNNLGFAQTIIRLLRNERGRRTLGRHARSFVLRHYSWERITETYSGVITNLCRSKNT
jgi:phosphatidylinositol alpha-1,6-mannosyltransferase